MAVSPPLRFAAVAVLWMLLGTAPAAADTGLPPFVSVTVTGSGTVRDDHDNSCSATCTFGYGIPGAPTPAAVTFSAGPGFQGWSGECADSGECRITLAGPTATHTVGATFASPSPEPTPSPSPVVPPPPAAPVAGFAPARTTLRAGERLVLDASVSAGDGLTGYAWDFGGGYGASCDAGEPLVAHAFTRPGRYSIALRVTDAVGRTSTAVQSILVQGAGRDANRLQRLGDTHAYACARFSDAGEPCFDRVVELSIVQALAIDGCFEEVPVRSLPINHVAPAAHVSDARSAPIRAGFDLGGRVWVAHGRVRLNGLDIVPSTSPSSIVLDERDDVIATSKVTVRVNGSPLVLLRDGFLSRRLQGGDSARLADFDVRRATPSFLDFGLEGSARVDLARGGGRSGLPPYATSVLLHAKLPDALGGLAADMRLVADNARGLHLDALTLDLPTAHIGAAELSAHLDYSEPAGEWRGRGRLILPGATGNFGLEVRSIVFRHGRFVEAQVGIPVPDVQIAPLMYLHEVRGGIHLDPPIISGGLTLSALTPSVGGKVVAPIDADLVVNLSHDWSIDGTATVKFVEVLSQTQHIHVDSTGFFSYDLAFDWDPLNAHVAELHGTLPVRYYQGEFDLEGNLRGCVVWGALCGGLKVAMSSKGVSACAEVHYLLVDVALGIGHRWGGGIDVLGGCDLGPYTVQIQASSSQVGAQHVALGGGAPFQVIRVIGRGGRPVVTLEGPNGERFTTPPEGVAHDSRFLAISKAATGPTQAVTDAADRSTYVVVTKPAAGDWKIVPASGSAAIERVLVANGLPKPDVTGHVSGTGPRRVLSYRVAPLPGQRVRFVQRGPDLERTLGFARGSAGRLAFRPVAGARIVALVEQDGLPRDELPVA